MKCLRREKAWSPECPHLQHPGGPLWQRPGQKLTQIQLPTANWCKRLGKVSMGKIRPIKATFASEQDALSVLRKPRLLQTLNIRAKNDLTPSQVQHLAQLRQELDVRTQAGEDGLIIRYINRIPAIVQSKNEPRAQSQTASRGN